MLNQNGLSGRKDGGATPVAGLEGSAAADAMKKVVKDAMAGIKGDLETLQAKVATIETPDLAPLRGELEGLKATISALESRIPASVPDHTEALNGLKAQVDALATQLQAPGAAARKPPQHIGQVIHEMEDFKSVISKSGGGANRVRIDLSKHVEAGSVRDILSGVKAAPTLGTDELGALNWSYRQSDVVVNPRESVAAYVPLIPRVSTPGAQVYDYNRERDDSAHGFMRTQLATALTGQSVTPVTSCDVDDASHFVDGTNVRFYDPTTNALLATLPLVSHDAVSSPNTLTFATNAIDFDMDADGNIVSEHWLGTPESDSKPYGLFAAESVSTNLITIASLTSVSRQMLISPAGILAWIERDMPERWLRNVAYQLLYGTGTANRQLPGFASDTNVQTYLWSSGAVGDNRIDALMSAALLVVGGDVTFVMNKRDFNLLRKEKDDTGNYLRSPTLGRISLEMGSDGMWMLDGVYPILLSDAVIDGDFFAIDFARASRIPDAEDAAMEIGLVNDQFARNERTVRYEHTIGHAIQSTAAYVYGQWDNTPVA